MEMTALISSNMGVGELIMPYQPWKTHGNKFKTENPLKKQYKLCLLRRQKVSSKSNPYSALKQRKGLEISERKDPGASAMSGIPPAHRDLCQGSEGKHRLGFSRVGELGAVSWGCPAE